MKLNIIRSHKNDMYSKSIKYKYYKCTMINDVIIGKGKSHDLIEECIVIMYYKSKMQRVQ